MSVCDIAYKYKHRRTFASTLRRINLFNLIFVQPVKIKLNRLREILEERHGTFTGAGSEKKLT